MKSGVARLRTRELKNLLRGTYKTVHSPAFSATYRFAEGIAVPQITCVVSKKVEKTAVGRNRIKRQCRSAVQEIAETFPRSLQAIIRAKPKASGYRYEAIQDEIKLLVSKL